MPDRMQPLDALVAAGAALLVSRPAGVAHVYAGPTTKTGMVPRGHRPVCNAHTRRLYDRSSFPVRGDLLVCARCSARLVESLPATRVEHPIPLAGRTMADDRRHYAALTADEIYLSIRFATTADELDQCSLALQLGFTPQQRAAEYTSPTGRTFPSLAHVVDQARRRITPRTQIQVDRPDTRTDPTYWDALRKAGPRIPKHRRHNIHTRIA